MKKIFALLMAAVLTAACAENDKSAGIHETSGTTAETEVSETAENTAGFKAETTIITTTAETAAATGPTAPEPQNSAAGLKLPQNPADWQTAYYDFLTENDFHESYINILDVNNDGVPEIITGKGLFYYYENSVYSIELWGAHTRSLSYIEATGQILTHDSASGAVDMKIYDFIDGKYEPSYTVYGEKYDRYGWSYYINGEEAGIFIDVSDPNRQYQNGLEQNVFISSEWSGDPDWLKRNNADSGVLFDIELIDEVEAEWREQNEEAVCIYDNGENGADFLPFPHEEDWVSFLRENLFYPQETGVVYADIDNDGIEEKTGYIQENNVLRITDDDGQILLEADLSDYGVGFNGIGMHTALYYYQYVSDSAGKIYLNVYGSYLIGEDYETEKRYSGATGGYYEIKDGVLNEVDSVYYSYIRDIRTDNESATYYINEEEPSDSLESIEAKYTPVENTYFEIQY